MDTMFPTEDSCSFCSAVEAPLALMVAMPAFNPRLDFTLQPACEFCYVLVVGSEIRSSRAVMAWPPPPGVDYKVWTSLEYDAAYFPDSLDRSVTRECLHCRDVVVLTLDPARAVYRGLCRCGASCSRTYG